MRKEVWTAMERAMVILNDGAVHPTEEFLVLIDKRTTDQEWSQRVRAVGMMTVLSKILDFTGNHLKLVQIARRGQAGLYQLQRREIFEVHPTNAFSRNSEEKAR